MILIPLYNNLIFLREFVNCLCNNYFIQLVAKWKVVKLRFLLYKYQLTCRRFIYKFSKSIGCNDWYVTPDLFKTLTLRQLRVATIYGFSSEKNQKTMRFISKHVCL